MNHEQSSTSLMAITRIDTTHGPTYSMATAIEASACQTPLARMLSSICATCWTTSASLNSQYLCYVYVYTICVMHSVA